MVFAALLAAFVLGLTGPAYGAQTQRETVAPSGIAQVGEVLYLADSWHRSIWAWDGDTVTQVAGDGERTDSTGRPLAGYRDGPVDEAMFSEPWSVVPYREGLLISDTGNHVIRYLDLEKEQVSTVVGTGAPGAQNGVGQQASFHRPTGLAVGEDGTVYIADTDNHVIRAMDTTGRVTTYAGGDEGCQLGTRQEAQFSGPTGLCWADGVLYVADTGNHRIVAIEGNQVTLVTGAVPGEAEDNPGGYLDGAAELAQFSNPQGVAVGEDGTVFLADTGNRAIRMLRDGEVTTLAQGTGSETYPVSPRGILVNETGLYVGDVFAQVLLQGAAVLPTEEGEAFGPLTPVPIG